MIHGESYDKRIKRFVKCVIEYQEFSNSYTFHTLLGKKLYY